jgi:gamma-glutamylcyclotransferase (GGCT)/AIG2-like uncharacterized protein YtfP
VLTALEGNARKAPQARREVAQPFQLFSEGLDFVTVQRLPLARPFGEQSEKTDAALDVVSELGGEGACRRCSICTNRIAPCHPRSKTIIGPVASVRLFVYGTLKRGGRYHDELCGAPFLGEATTAPGYELVQLGEYLALVETGKGPDSVTGELFEVPEALLASLDEFEGDAYIRRQLAVWLTGGENGAEVMALAYFLKPR